MVFFGFSLEAEIIQQTHHTCPLPSPYTDLPSMQVQVGAAVCTVCTPEAPLEPRRKVGPLGPIKTFCQKKNIWGDVVPGASGVQAPFMIALTSVSPSPAFTVSLKPSPNLRLRCSWFPMHLQMT